MRFSQVQISHLISQWGQKSDIRNILVSDYEKEEEIKVVPYSSKLFFLRELLEWLGTHLIVVVLEVFSL